MPELLKSKWRIILPSLAVVIAVTSFLTWHFSRVERPLTSILEIWQWNARNKPSRPVVLRAAVTYYDPAWRMLNVQTSDGGLFLDPDFWPQELRPGTVVDISGYSDPKSVMTHLSVKTIALGELPKPVQTTIAEIAGAKNPGALVSLKGTVRWVKNLDSRTTIRLASGTRAVNVRVLQPSAELLQLTLDSVIEVTGVASPPRNNVPYGEVFVTNGESIKVLRAGTADLFTLPLSNIEELVDAGTSGGEARAVHVRETIIGQSSDGDWMIGAPTAQLHVRPLERMLAQPGDVIETAGFLSADGQELVLADAAVRLVTRVSRTTNRVLTHAAEVTGLDPSEAAVAIPVRFTASVTFFDPWWRLLFVQDSTAGVFVEDVPPDASLRIGDIVQIDGESRIGGFIPDVAKPTIKNIGHGSLPHPAPASNEDLLAGKFDSRLVEVTGIVHGVTYNPDQKRMVLDVVSGTVNIKAQLLTPTTFENPKSLIDCKVKLVGIAGTILNQNMQMVGISLFVQDKSFLSVLEPGIEEPFAVPPSEIHSLLRFRATKRVQHRVHLAGTVLLQDADTLYLRDSSGVIAARLMEPLATHPGDAVHVAGFITPGETRPYLANSLAILRGVGQPATAQLHSAAELLGGAYDSDLVSVQGTVLSSSSSALGWELLLQSESHTFNAILRTDPVKQPLPAIDPGSVVRLTGVAEMQANPNVMMPGAMSFRIHLRDSNDLVVVSAPPWWSLRRIFIVAAAFVFVVGVALAWVVMLRRRVQQQTELIHKQTSGLLRAERLASIGQLVAGVAHELNNPLTAVMGYSDLLMDDIEADHHRDKLQKLGREARRMKRIIDNLLHFARPRVTGRQEVELEQVIRGALALQEYNLQCRGIKIELSFQSGLPKIQLDEDQFKQVFLNLLNNSLHALADVEDKRISIDAHLDGEAVAIRFGDSGRGFEDVHRAFDPFYTTKPVGQGTGLGLSICYGIVKEHGGDISVQNLEPTGAVVTLKLPVARGWQHEQQASAT
jgi:signal transduction histidine kinase